MLIGYDFCIANGLVLDCYKGKIALQRDGKSVELEIMNSREEAHAEGDCCEPLNNSEVYSARKDHEIEDEIEAATTNHSVTGSSKDRVIRDVGEYCSANVMPVATLDRSMGEERREVNHPAQSVKEQGARPEKGEVNATSALQYIHVEEGLSKSQKERLSTLILQYQEYFSRRPGKCNCYEYKFQVQDGVPKSRHSRPIPFSLRREVQEQIEEMLADNIIEESYSSYVNPLTLVQREGKRVRICLDAREVNKFMTPDRAKVPPMQTLLQRFHGAKFISAIDLNSAFLQIPLDKNSRKWTAFQFQNKVFEFTRVPYRYRNSLSAFIRALQTVLGPDTNEYAVHYVDDLVVFSKKFEEHLRHLDLVFSKLTTAGFTMNLEKCNFCKPEIKFLSHIISRDSLRPDPQRIESVLSYPAPRNQKQLKKFLGVCNFHQRFIVNYAECVAPLLQLLRKNIPWSWSTEMQKAFETLQNKFANSIQLVQPDEDLPYIINTDASARAIGAVLSQQNSEGITNIVSTASRVLTQTEQRYTTCEQELLGIVYALEKFRIYIYGHKVILYTDNKALTFLNRCAITSNRVARWIVNLQQYDIELRHVRGTQNHLADVISRNPAGLNMTEIKNLTKPNVIMVNKINLNVDKSVCKDLRNLTELQRADTRIQKIQEGLAQKFTIPNSRYRLVGDTLFYGEAGSEPEWKPVLPACLEERAIQYTHTSLGHLGVEKCVQQIKQAYHVKNLGRKVRRFIAGCDTCQRVKFPNRAFATEERSHLPTKPGSLCAIDLFGSLPTSRGGVKYILVCYVFSKHVKLPAESRDYKGVSEQAD
jgi:hypothetical protein